MEKPLLPSAYHANSPKGSSCPANPLPYFWALPLLSSFPHAPRLIPSHPLRRVLVLRLPLLRALLVLRAAPLPPRPAAKKPKPKNLKKALPLNRRPNPRLRPRSPELLYCDPGNLTILGTFSDGTERPTELCDTPSHRRSVRAEEVCGGQDGRYKYPEEWAELCNGGLPPSDSDYPDNYGDIDTGYAPESGAVTDAPADSDTGAVEVYEY